MAMYLEKKKKNKKKKCARHLGNFLYFLSLSRMDEISRYIRVKRFLSWRFPDPLIVVLGPLLLVKNN